MTTEEVAARAADVIEERGHIKHALSDANGVCLIGALNIAVTGMATGFYYEAQEVARLVAEVVQPQVESPRINSSSKAVWWNNQPERTAEDVIGVLRYIAAGAAVTADPHAGSLVA